MSDAAPIDRLRAIARHLDEIQHPDATWFAAALAAYESGARHGMTLDDALGLRVGQGERPWWAVEAMQQRDELLRAIARQHFPSMSRRAAAAAIAHELNRYRESRWRVDRAYRQPPAQLLGSVRAELFRLLKLDVPLGVGTLRRALDSAREPLAHETGISVRQRRGHAPAAER